MLKMIDVARTQLGVAEATGNNDGIPAERYMRGDKLAWCAGFVLWCNANSDDRNIAATTKEHYELRSVSRMIEVFKARGWFHTGSPEPNDIVFFGNAASDVGVRGNHVGIVEEAKGLIVSTIEGNTSNRVARVRHRLNDKTIVGYGRVPPET